MEEGYNLPEDCTCYNEEGDCLCCLGCDCSCHDFEMDFKVEK